MHALLDCTNTPLRLMNKTSSIVQLYREIAARFYFKSTAQSENNVIRKLPPQCARCIQNLSLYTIIFRAKL